jgi:serine phosphatase RsbU (regulator of sigma subunit)
MKKKPSESPFTPKSPVPGRERQPERIPDQTVTFTVDSTAADRQRPRPAAHFLVPVDSPEHSLRVDQGPVAVGRSSANQLALEDRSVSQQHCVVQLRRGDLWVEDLGSTNGTLVDGRCITGPTLVPVGSMLQVGKVRIRHELRDEQAVADDAEWSGELKAASRYITDLLPEPWSARRVNVQWRFVPCRRLGGDSLGYADLDADHTAIYLIDVCGHGLRAALHSVAILNAIRLHSFPEDYSDPGAILTRLNRTFPMEAHGGMYFTIWYGVLDLPRRRLRFSSGGHPPAILRGPASAAPRRLEMRRPPIGTGEKIVYTSEEVKIPPDSLLYVFSDGVFEEPGPDGQLLGLSWLEEVVLRQRAELQQEPERIEAALRAMTGTSRFQDDFTLLVAQVP